MSRRKTSGTVITATVKGDTSGLIAIGENNQQSQIIQSGPDEDLQALLQDWSAQLDALKQAIEHADLPQADKLVAQVRVSDLEEQVKSGKPKQAILDQVGTWFAGHIPDLLTAITGLLTHPAVIKLIEGGANTLRI